MERNKLEIHFAPLQGYTDPFFRNAFAKYFGGVDVYYTPFIRVEKGTFRKKDARDILPALNNVPALVPQILPGSRDEFRMLTDLVCENGYRAIDINLGCSFPLIAGKRKGAGMLPFPDRVKEVLSTLEEYPDCHFSVKMRLGWEKYSECMDLAGIINDLRLQHVTIHARIGKQQYKGEPNLEAFDSFYRVCRHPLFYNGDLCSVGDLLRIREKFPLLRGVSIGRGFLSSPFIGRDYQENETFPDEKRMALLLQFHDELFSAYSATLQGENQLLSKMRTLWELFLPETDRKLLKRIKKATKLYQYTEAIKMIFTPS